MPTIRLGNIGLDCADPHALAVFWADLLDGEIVYENETVCVVKMAHMLLTTYRVQDYRPPTWPQNTVPKQAHLDLDVEDLDDAERQAITAGAARAATQPDPSTYLVMLDPAGHPFCLTTQIPDHLKPPP